MGSWMAVCRTGSGVPAGALAAAEQGNRAADTESQALPAGPWEAAQSGAECQEAAGEASGAEIWRGCCVVDLFLISLGWQDRASGSVCLN